MIENFCKDKKCAAIWCKNLAKNRGEWFWILGVIRRNLAVAGEYSD
jgi:hypothetical protein